MYSSEPLNDFGRWSDIQAAEEKQRDAEFQQNREDFLKAARHGDATANLLNQKKRDYTKPLGHGNYEVRPELLWETTIDLVESNKELAMRLVQLLLGSANNGNKVAAELVADIANAYAESQQP